jgi:hypothetical protein
MRTFGQVTILRNPVVARERKKETHFGSPSSIHD